MRSKKEKNEMDIHSKFKGLDIESLNVLDLGCGHNNSPISSQVLTLPFDFLTSVDIHRPYLDILRDKPMAARQHQIVKSEIIAYVVEQIKVGYYFDVALLLDVVEHFVYGDAVRLLGFLEAIIHKRIIIWIPLDICTQNEYNNNPYQVHLSTWRREDLENLGYEVSQLANYHRSVAWATKDL